ncbi:unnamed protein product [Trichobilharzia szidati]|nr:unnamed protein product [Trichobilharzia szidati]
MNFVTSDEDLLPNILLDSPHIENDILFSTSLMSEDEWKHIISMVLNSIEKAINFLWKHRYKVNLDGYIGPRMVERVIQALLKLYEEKIPNSVVVRMQIILRNIQTLCDFGLNNVPKETPFYFSRVGFLLNPQLWNRFYPVTLLNYSSIYHSKNEGGSMTEYDSDNCLRELLDKTDDGLCEISDKCWKLVTDESETDYGLTHQLLYIMIGLQSNCGETMNYLLKSDRPWMNTETYMQQLCTNVAIEAQTIANNSFPVESRDLFMEQVGFCGIAGFWQICRMDWLNKIIAWQEVNGCYHKFNKELINPRNFGPNEYGHYKRRKRSEEILSNGSEACLSHRTSVALTALGSYLRYLVEFY